MTNSKTSRFDLEGTTIPAESRNEVIQGLASHASIRSFTPDPVPATHLTAILTAARSASTSSNLQTYSIIKVTDQAKRLALGELVPGQAYVKESPLFLVFCADLHRLQVVTEAKGQQFQGRTLEMLMQAVVDATLAAQNAAVAAESLGLGIVYIGGLRNAPEKAAQILGLPPLVFALVGLCIGYPAHPGSLRRRLPQEMVVHENEYSSTELEKHLATEGEKPAEKEFHLWAAKVAQSFSQPDQRRRDLAETLKKLGFDY